MYLLVTVSDNLNSFYDDHRHNKITYLGYTDDESVAEQYAKQFRGSIGTVLYTETSLRFINQIFHEYKIDIQEILMITSEDEKVSIALTAWEVDHIDEILGDSSMTEEFEDIKFAIDNLDRFTDKRIRRLRKQLKELYKTIVDPDTDEDMELSEEYLGSVDLAKQYKFVAQRIGLFEYNYKNKTGQ